MHDLIWTVTAVETCIAAGVDHFFVAPGSRCTPLTLAIAALERAGDRAPCITQHVDERGLAFAALGYAHATGRPGVFVCTSGTAVANALPAVIEASQLGLPMLLFTADRPPELRDTGANQTIDQVHLFGRYARWFADMPCPYAEPTAPPQEGGPPKQLPRSPFVRSQVTRAIEESARGPVHVNWMFREPFSTDVDAVVGEKRGEELRRASDVLPDEPERTIKTERRDAGVDCSAGSSPPNLQLTADTVCVLGQCRPEHARAVRDFAQQHGLPLVTDATCGVAGLSPELPKHAATLPRPGTVLHFGARMVGKTWPAYVADCQATMGTRCFQFDGALQAWNPHRLRLDFCRTDLTQVGEWSLRTGDTARTASEFATVWNEAGKARCEAVRSVLDAETALSEPVVAADLARLLPPEHGLFLGNSTPIRDFDWYADWPQAESLRVAANRGASGIDGGLASAIGLAVGLRRPTTLVLGDLSMLHDLNSLALLSRSPVPVTVVLINNQAGGIFDLLPIAKQSQDFERFFATPHAWQFGRAAEMFGVEYVRADSLVGWRQAYQAAVTRKHSTVLELTTDRAQNQRTRTRLTQAVATRLGT